MHLDEVKKINRDKVKFLKNLPEDTMEIENPHDHADAILRFLQSGRDAVYWFNRFPHQAHDEVANIRSYTLHSSNDVTWVGREVSDIGTFCSENWNITISDWGRNDWSVIGRTICDNIRCFRIGRRVILVNVFKSPNLAVISTDNLAYSYRNGRPDHYRGALPGRDDTLRSNPNRPITANSFAMGNHDLERPVAYTWATVADFADLDDLEDHDEY